MMWVIQVLIRSPIVGSRASGHQRLRAPGREALAEPELRADGDGRDLDAVVSDHQAEECSVRPRSHILTNNSSPSTGRFVTKFEY